MAFFPLPGAGEEPAANMEGTLETQKNGQRIKLGGAVMLDLDSASSEFWDEEEEKPDDWQTRLELRRVRLSIKAKLPDGFKTKLQFDFAGDDGTVEIKDAYIRYDGFKVVDITVGQHKEPFGLEATTSSNKLSFIERSMVSDAFRPGRNIGISCSGGPERISGQIGVFDTGTNESDEENIFEMSGRLGVLPWKSKTGFFHLGVSGAYQYYGGKEFEIKEPAQIHTADNIVFSDEIHADYVTIYGLEGAFGKGPFSLAAEYMSAEIKAVGTDDKADFNGYYFSGSWFLTGEAKPFKDRDWGQVRPESSWGAWELAARYSYIDAAENDYGTLASAYTGGVNWHINSFVKLMVNYQHLRLMDDKTKGDNVEEAVSLRFQCVF